MLDLMENHLGFKWDEWIFEKKLKKMEALGEEDKHF